jgi:hypothetical protein
MDYEDHPDDDRHRIAKRIADLQKMLRSLQGAKRSARRVQKIALSGEISAVAGIVLSRREGAIRER